MNQSYTGNLQTQNDKDYFRFEILQKGNVSITFNHEQFDNDFNYWEIYLVANGKTILKFNSQGKTSSLTSDVVRLPAGTYYLRINTYYHSNLDYNFSVNYNQENELFESEPNDDYSFATNINLDVEYTGNIQSKEDVDFYKIDIIENISNIEFYFMHDITDENSTYWYVYFLDNNGNRLSFIDDNNNRLDYLNIKGNDSQSKFYVNDLYCGSYYIKITAYYYKNDDYSLLITEI